MIRTIPFAAIALLLSVLFAQMTANAGVTIIATVNGKPITNYDVEQRSRFLGYATNIEITDQNRDRLYEDSLQLIIEDKLRLEAARDMLPDIEAVVLPQAVAPSLVPSPARPSAPPPPYGDSPLPSSSPLGCPPPSSPPPCSSTRASSTF